MPRLSADVDVTLALEPDTPEPFAREMGAAGFALRVRDPDFVRRTRVMPFAHAATGVPLDVVLAGSGLEDDFLARAREMDVAGTTVRVIDPGNPVIAKVLAGIHQGDIVLSSRTEARSGAIRGAERRR